MSAGEKKEVKTSIGSSGPGPAVVMLPPTIGFINHDKTRNQMPAYSMSRRQKGVMGGGSGPGPVYMIPPGMTAKGPSGVPAYSMRIKPKAFENSKSGPGPAAYTMQIAVNHQKAPAYSMTPRNSRNDKGSSSPGPIYLIPSTFGPGIPDKASSPVVTIKGRGSDKKTSGQSPGPIYDIGRPDLIKLRAAQVGLKGNRNELKSQTYEAGPANYDVAKCTEKVRRSFPAFSMGIRHSPFIGTLLTTCDKVSDSLC